MPASLESRFQNLHEFVKAARTNLNRNVWDYLIVGSETETTVAGNRMALDAWPSQKEVWMSRDLSGAEDPRAKPGRGTSGCFEIPLCNQILPDPDSREITPGVAGMVLTVPPPLLPRSCRGG